MEIYISPLPPPQIRDRKLARFGFCAASSLIWGGWGVGGGLLIHFILSKIVVKITVGWVVRGKICIGQQGTLTQKQDDKNRLPYFLD